MNWKIIFNPFAKFSEISLLIFGLVITLVGSWIGAYFGVIYDGVLDVHVSEISFLESLKFNFINVVSVFIFLFGLGKLVNPKSRLIDILNTVLISRIPIYIIGILINFFQLKNFSENVTKGNLDLENLPFDTADLVLLMIFTLISFAFLAYKITLLVFGFKTATNAKKWHHWLFFAIAILLAEILSKFLISSF